MVTKEKIKQAIDEIPEDLLDEVFEFLRTLKTKNKKKKKIRTFKLKGQFDNINVREKAYE